MIEVIGVTKRYKDKLAVDDLSFEVKSGQVTGFLGPNGSGKSTTMRMIMGLDAPDAGTALVNGRTYRHLPVPLREVGALLEAKAIHPGRSAFNHLWYLAQSNDIPRLCRHCLRFLHGLGQPPRSRGTLLNFWSGELKPAFGFQFPQTLQATPELVLPTRVLKTELLANNLR